MVIVTFALWQNEDSLITTIRERDTIQDVNNNNSSLDASNDR